ncbi:MAG: hypothetical protein AAF721_07910 [Myxococcota bacterium]
MKASPVRDRLRRLVVAALVSVACDTSKPADSPRQENRPVDETKPEPTPSEAESPAAAAKRGSEILSKDAVAIKDVPELPIAERQATTVAKMAGAQPRRATQGSRSAQAAGAHDGDRENANAGANGNRNGTSQIDGDREKNAPSLRPRDGRLSKDDQRRVALAVRTACPTDATTALRVTVSVTRKGRVTLEKSVPAGLAAGSPEREALHACAKKALEAVRVKPASGPKLPTGLVIVKLRPSRTPGSAAPPP